MTAESIAMALGGRKVGDAWMALCPAHEDRDPSLSIRDADSGVLVHCHAGCTQEKVIAALRARGLWNGVNSAASANEQEKSPRDDVGRSEVALGIWEAAKPAAGTLIETYLASRGLHLPPPNTLRFHSGLKHPSGDAWPAMLALVTM